MGMTKQGQQAYPEGRASLLSWDSTITRSMRGVSLMCTASVTEGFVEVRWSWSGDQLGMKWRF